MREVRLNIYNERPQNKNLNSKRTLQNLKNLPGSANVSRRVSSKSRRWSDHFHSEVLQINDNSLSALTADGDVIGIITMEDVIEKLLKVRTVMLSACLPLLSSQTNCTSDVLISLCRKKSMMRLIIVTVIHSLDFI